MIPYLESPNLIYKPISEEHISQRYVNWLNDPLVYQYLETGGGYTIQKLDGYIKQMAMREDVFFWAIHIKETHTHIGNIKIDSINARHGVGEYGILIGDSSVWGRGYAYEASVTVLDYCFHAANLRKIVLGVVSENKAALRVYEKLGFKVEGVYKEHGYYNGKYQDIIRMAIFNPNL